MTTSGSAGGAAAAGGFEFQARVAAWYATRMLAERPVGLGLTGRPVLVRCETGQPVDDLLLVVDDGGAVYGQVKTSLPLSRDPDSSLASVIDQFVRQYVANVAGARGAEPWMRPLDEGRDRLVLVVGPDCPGTVSRDLRELFDRLRTLPLQADPSSLPLTQVEQTCWEACSSMAVTAWKNVFGQVPSLSEVRTVLRYAHVVPLNLDRAGPDTETALELLRSQLLVDPAEAEKAWDVLSSVCLKFVHERTGADRNALVAELRSRELGLRPAPSYAPDIAKLTNHTESQLAILSSYASIRIGAERLHTERACSGPLLAAADDGDVVVVGEPGAGKSAVLHDFVNRAKAANRSVVLFCADQLDARSIASLRDELGLSHDFLDVLRGWPGTLPGFVVIDALDAARAEVTARTLRNLIAGIQHLNSRWRIVVSIRKFDLRYSHELGRLFAGTPPASAFVDKEFGRVRHLNVPPLTDQELGVLLGASPKLRGLVLRTEEPLRSLARTPFYLFLLAQLLDAGLTNEELSVTRTALELLDRFWAFRVLRDDKRGPGREALLLRVCDQMMDLQRLYVDRMAISRDSEGEALVDDLLSTNLLAERPAGVAGGVDRYALTFAHHIFFDYSVARLSFRGGAESLETRLRMDPSLVLTVRPSIHFVFHRLWLRDAGRDEFWSCMLALCSGDAPVLARLVGCNIAARESVQPSEFGPLVSALRSSDSRARGAAEDALLHIIAVVVDDQIVAAKILWAALADAVSAKLSPRSAQALRVLLDVVTKREGLGQGEGVALASASRNLLSYALTSTPRHGMLVQLAIRVAARTVPFSPEPNVNALAAVLAPEHVSKWGYEELFWLALELKALVGCAPELIRDTYIAAFGFKETSKETTSLGDSQIMGLTSHRAQDFEGALYQLSELFPAFLEAEPQLGIQVLAYALNEYVQRDHHPPQDARPLQFEVMGIPVRARVDYSSIWDAGNTYAHDNAVRLLDAWDEYVRELAAANNVPQLKEVLQAVAQHNAVAVAWKRLLVIGSEYPAQLAPLLGSLLESEDVLAGVDTSAAAGEMLKTAYSLLDEDRRRRIEQTILAITKDDDPDKADYAKRIRLRLLNCIVRDGLLLEESRRQLEQGEREGPLPGNCMPPGPKVTSRPYGETEFLAEQGVPVHEPSNRALRCLEEPVAKFAADFMNSHPSGEAFRAGIEALKALADGLRGATESGAHPAQVRYAGTVLAQGAAAAAKYADLDSADAADCVVAWLLDASESQVPEPRDEDHEFDSPSWSPAPRIEAAEGLLELARFSKLLNDKVVAAIRRLARDPVPAVRFQVAIRLVHLRDTDESLFWELVSGYCSDETTRGVLSGVLRGGLGPVVRSDAPTAVPLILSLYARTAAVPSLKELAADSAELLAGAYVADGNPAAATFARNLVEELPATAFVASHVCGYLRDALVFDESDEPSEHSAQIRERSIRFVTDALRRANRVLEDWRNGGRSHDEESLKEVARLVDSAAAQVYFAAGGRADRTQGAHRDERATRLYHEGRAALEAIADSGIPSATHYLMQTLELLIEADPPGVFRLVARSVLKGRDGGYEYESLGADVAVRILERYLADHRDVFRLDRECRSELIGVLETFVRVGWPSARRLANSLEDMFR